MEKAISGSQGRYLIAYGRGGQKKKAGKGPQRPRGTPVFYLVHESPVEEQCRTVLLWHCKLVHKYQLVRSRGTSR